VTDIYTEHSARAWTAFPALRATGDIIPDGPRTMRGSDKGTAGVPHYRSGTLTINGEALEAELEEE
jgi:hypothetical protein